MEKNKLAYLTAFLIQLLYTGMFLLSKAAFDGGMSTYIFVFYRQAAGTLFLGPLAFFIKGSVPFCFYDLHVCAYLDDILNI